MQRVLKAVEIRPIGLILTFCILFKSFGGIPSSWHADAASLRTEFGFAMIVGTFEIAGMRNAPPRTTEEHADTGHVARPTVALLPLCVKPADLLSPDGVYASLTKNGRRLSLPKTGAGFSTMTP
jgi:hypothetical protein